MWFLLWIPNFNFYDSVSSIVFGVGFLPRPMRASRLWMEPIFHSWAFAKFLWKLHTFKFVYIHTHAHMDTYSLSPTHTNTHTHIHSYILKLTYTQIFSLSISNTHILSLSLSSHSLTHTNIHIRTCQVCELVCMQYSYVGSQ